MAGVLNAIRVKEEVHGEEIEQHFLIFWQRHKKFEN